MAASESLHSGPRRRKTRPQGQRQTAGLGDTLLFVAQPTHLPFRAALVQGRGAEPCCSGDRRRPCGGRGAALSPVSMQKDGELVTESEAYA